MGVTQVFVKLFVIFVACGEQVRVGCGRNEEARTQPGTRGGGGGGTLGIYWWGCAAGTLEPLTYTRAS